MHSIPDCASRDFLCTACSFLLGWNLEQWCGCHLRSQVLDHLKVEKEAWQCVVAMLSLGVFCR